MPIGNFTNSSGTFGIFWEKSVKNYLCNFQTCNKKAFKILVFQVVQLIRMIRQNIGALPKQILMEIHQKSKVSMDTVQEIVQFNSMINMELKYINVIHFYNKGHVNPIIGLQKIKLQPHLSLTVREENVKKAKCILTMAVTKMILIYVERHKF